jgi:hypothetical protein
MNSEVPEKSIDELYKEYLDQEIPDIKWQPMSPMILDEKVISVSDMYFYFTQTVSELQLDNRKCREKVKQIFEKYQETVSALYLKSLECELLKNDLKNLSLIN